jgi:hypothetical protein
MNNPLINRSVDMDMLILKTNINTNFDFKYVRNSLNHSYKINECTVDLTDRDKVLRLIGEDLKMEDVINRINKLGYYCEDLPG